MKTCKVCGREVSQLWSKGRCFYCSKVAYARKMRATSRRKPARPKKRSRKVILDGLFSNYIKSRNEDLYGHIYCFTSLRRLPRAKIDAGHYIPRTHMKYRWHERNVFPQSISDNRFKNGATEIYRRHLVELYGEHYVEEMEVARHAATITSALEIDEMIEYYEQKTDELEPDENIGRITDQGRILWKDLDGAYICLTKNGLILT